MLHSATMPSVGMDLKRHGYISGGFSLPQDRIGYDHSHALMQLEQAVFMTPQDILTLCRGETTLNELSLLISHQDEGLSSHGFLLLSAVLRAGESSVAAEVAGSSVVPALIDALHSGVEWRRSDSLTILCQLSVTISAVTVLQDSGTLDEVLAGCAALLPHSMLPRSSAHMIPSFSRSCGLAAMVAANLTAQTSEVRILPGSQALEQAVLVLLAAVRAGQQRSGRPAGRHAPGRLPGAAWSPMQSAAHDDGAAAPLTSAEALCGLCNLALCEDNHPALLAAGVDAPLADLIVDFEFAAGGPGVGKEPLLPVPCAVTLQVMRPRTAGCRRARRACHAERVANRQKLRAGSLQHSAPDADSALVHCLAPTSNTDSLTVTPPG